MTDNEIIMALECCIESNTVLACADCPLLDTKQCVGTRKTYVSNFIVEQGIDLINRQKAEVEKKNTEIDILIRKKDTLQDENSELMAEVERLKEERDAMHRDLVTEEEYAFNLHIKQKTAKSEAIREFAEKINEVFLRYAHLHDYAEKSRTETIESAEGEKIEMQSVWDVLSLKKYEMAEYEEMNRLQNNIETIAKERLLTELEKDFRLLKKEMVGEEK